MDGSRSELSLTIEAEEQGLLARARDLAARLGAASVRLEGTAPDVPADARGATQRARGRARPEPADGQTARELVLSVRRDGLTLRLGTGPKVRASRPALVPPKGHGPDPLWRAVLAGEYTVVDATAGLGGDGFHLAARGAVVTMIERSPVVAALLEDALLAAATGALGPEAAEAAARVRLVVGDARDVLRAGALEPRETEVVYLDPMFHATGRRSLPPKGMALFRALMGADYEAAADLLAAAREVASRRVVVKRHLRSPRLSEAEPSGAIRSRTVRYDLYAPL